MYFPSTIWTRAFMALVLLEAAIVLSFECYVFARFQLQVEDDDERDSSNSDTSGGSDMRAITTYLTLFIFAWLFQFALVYDALRLKNTIQIFGLCIFNFLMLIYSSVQIEQLKEAVNGLKAGPPQPQHTAEWTRIWNSIYPFLLAIPIVVGVITLFMAFVAWKLYDEFAWTIYKHISADLRMKRRYLIFQIYITLLKFDFFFFLGFTVQFLVIVLNTTDTEFILTIIVIPLTIIILLAAAWFTRRENKPGTIVVIILYCGALAYFLFKLVRMYHSYRAKDYYAARHSLTIFAVITVILIVLTIAISIKCMLNYNKGLKPHISRRRMESEEDKHQMKDFGGSPNVQHTPPARMEID